MSKTVLITGASAGFGKLTAELLAREGYTVFATMRNTDDGNADLAQALAEAANEGDWDLEVVDMDVTSDESVAKAVAYAESQKPIDVVVNNAGIFCWGFAESFTIEDFQRIFDVNLYGVQRVNRAVLPHMRKRSGGLLVHMSTVSALTPFPFSLPYAATKSALEALAQGYRYELAPLGVDSVIVEPGSFPTAIFDRGIEPSDAEAYDGYEEMHGLIDKVFQGIKDSINSRDAMDPNLVAKTIRDLIEMRPGTRPLRTVVTKTKSYWERINTTSSQIQEELMELLSLDHLQSVKR